MRKLFRISSFYLKSSFEQTFTKNFLCLSQARLNTGESQSTMIHQLDPQVSDLMSCQPVITSLERCIKELIDNSIDGNATFIKISLQNYGKESFSVYDNGDGIRDIQKIGFKGATSKNAEAELQDRSKPKPDQLDLSQRLQHKESQSSLTATGQKRPGEFLDSIKTLGFRGEALCSMSRLCEQMVIQTVFSQYNQALQNQNPNTELPQKEGVESRNYQNLKANGRTRHHIQCKYDVKSMKIIEKVQASIKKTSTMVTVKNIFNNVPIRRHELQNHPKQNLKQIYDTLFEISLIYPEIKFILANTRCGKQQELLLETNSWGSKADCQNSKKWEQMWRNRLYQCFPSKLQGKIIFISNKNIQGFVLKTIQSGSSKKNHQFAKNYQFLFLNRRPISPLPELVKLIEFFYKKYNPYTKYAFFLNLKLSSTEIDVNRSINKRNVFVVSQMMKKVQQQLKVLIEREVVQKIINLQEFNKISQKSQRADIESQRKPLKENDSRKMQNRLLQEEKQKKNQIAKVRKEMFPNSLNQPKKSQISLETSQLPNQTSQQIETKLNSLFRGTALPSTLGKQQDPKNRHLATKKSYHNQSKDQTKIERKSYKSEQKHTTDTKQRIQSLKFVDRNSVDESLHDEKLNKKSLQSQSLKIHSEVKENDKTIFSSTNNFQTVSQNKISDQKIYKVTDGAPNNQRLPLQLGRIEQDHSRVSEKHFQKKSQMKFVEKAQKLKSYQEPDNAEKNQISPQVAIPGTKFHFQNETLNYVTEKNNQLKKSDFTNFYVHGQFNRGFIVCSLEKFRSQEKISSQSSVSQLEGKIQGGDECSTQNQYSLYVVDQHAAEEKSWFESFMKSKPQFSISNQSCKISPMEADAIEIAHTALTESGFSYEFDKERSKVILNRVPMFSFLNKLKKVMGLKEFFEIVKNNRNIRELPEFYNIAASTACRKAVMIGDKLEHKQMEKIVHKLSELKSPWNCPHGRPTLVQLGNYERLSQLNQQRLKKKYRLDFKQEAEAPERSGE